MRDAYPYGWRAESCLLVAVYIIQSSVRHAGKKPTPIRLEKILK
jgi:hypothetical protein